MTHLSFFRMFYCRFSMDGNSCSGSKGKNMLRLSAMLLWACFVSIGNISAQQAGRDTAQRIAASDTAKQKTIAPGTSKVWGIVDGVAIEGLVEGPSTVAVPLQVACVFEYTVGDIFNSPPALPRSLNGMLHLDESLHGLITDIRKSDRFRGHAYETLLITPPAGMIAAKKLLLIGLGDRNRFTAEMMAGIGAVASREAVRLGVTSFSFASDLKDGGIDSPTALVAELVTKGILGAYQTEVYLKSQKMASFKPLTKVILLAGPAFFSTAGEGIQQGIASFNK